MTAELITLPVIRRLTYGLDFIEQSDREWAALQQSRLTPPHRTRPISLINNDRAVPRSAFERSARTSKHLLLKG